LICPGTTCLVLSMMARRNPRNEWVPDYENNESVEGESVYEAIQFFREAGTISLP